MSRNKNRNRGNNYNNFSKSTNTGPSPPVSDVVKEIQEEQKALNTFKRETKYNKKFKVKSDLQYVLRGGVYHYRFESGKDVVPGVMYGYHPCVVISTSNLCDTNGSWGIIVCPITSTEKPSHISEAVYLGELETPSYVLCNQMFTVSKGLLTEFMGVLSEQNLKRVLTKVKQCLGMQLDTEMLILEPTKEHIAKYIQDHVNEIIHESAPIYASKIAESIKEVLNNDINLKKQKKLDESTYNLMKSKWLGPPCPPPPPRSNENSDDLEELIKILNDPAIVNSSFKDKFTTQDINKIKEVLDENLNKNSHEIIQKSRIDYDKFMEEWKSAVDSKFSQQELFGLAAKWGYKSVNSAATCYRQRLKKQNKHK